MFEFHLHYGVCVGLPGSLCIVFRTRWPPFVGKEPDSSMTTAHGCIIVSNLTTAGLMDTLCSLGTCDGMLIAQARADQVKLVSRYMAFTGYHRSLNFSKLACLPWDVTFHDCVSCAEVALR